MTMESGRHTYASAHPHHDPISSHPAAGRVWWDAHAKEEIRVQV